MDNQELDELERPLSAYQLYLEDHGKTLQAQHPDKKWSEEIMPLLGQNWNALDDGEREKYEERAILLQELEQRMKAREEQLQKEAREHCDEIKTMIQEMSAE